MKKNSSVIPAGAEKTAAELDEVSTISDTDDILDETAQRAQKHDRFFFEDGNVIFLVQSKLYCVHRYFFTRDSSYFSIHLFAPHFDTAKKSHEADILKTIINIDDIESRDFDAFLSILYPTNFDETDVCTVEGWASVLHLANMWSFNSIRRLAITRLTGLASPVDKLVYGHKYAVGEWLVPAYVSLCQRQEVLSFEEGRRLSSDDIILIMTIRESIRENSRGSSTRSHGSGNTMQLSSEEIAHRVQDLISKSLQIDTSCSPLAGASPHRSELLALPSERSEVGLQSISSQLPVDPASATAPPSVNNKIDNKQSPTQETKGAAVDAQVYPKQPVDVKVIAPDAMTTSLKENIIITPPKYDNQPLPKDAIDTKDDRNRAVRPSPWGKNADPQSWGPPRPSPWAKKGSFEADIIKSV